MFREHVGHMRDFVLRDEGAVERVAFVLRVGGRAYARLPGPGIAQTGALGGALLLYLMQLTSLAGA